MPSEEDTWLSRTRQGWKLRLWLIASVPVVVSFVLAIAGNRSLLFPLSVVFVVLFLSSTTWFRCRACHRSVGWWVLSKQPAGTYPTALAKLQKCPYCGDMAQPLGHPGAQPPDDGAFG
jgi:hypothetical protein